VTNSLKTKTYLDSLCKFNASTKLSQAIMTYIVSNISYKEVSSDILALFRKLDQNGDGKISKLELIEGLVKVHPYRSRQDVEKEVDEIMNQIDSNISGSIDYTEFLVACLNREKILSQKLVEQAFKVFDLNGDGYVTQAEFQAVMGGVVLD
jgi:calcium-dependent protein kinase